MSSASWSIGIVCYPTFGGSGVMATEIGMGLAELGHKIHLLATAPPVRMRPHPNVMFHQVHVPSYPLFQYPPYSIALASTIAEVCRSHKLDILHVHYAVPHAVSAYLACQMLGSEAPKVVTTLHGTDVTRVGAETSYQPIIRMALMASDGLTTPSEFLQKTAYQELNIPESKAIQVIPNFVNTEQFFPSPSRNGKPPDVSHLFPNDPDGNGSPLLIHVSNFRPVKRVLDVVDVFAKVSQQHPARLLMLGEGPDRPEAMKRINDLGLTSKVCFVDNSSSVVEHLQFSDVMLLPSETESFGLAALEALSCGVPVVASDVGGLPELVQHSTTGFLAPVGDTEKMAEATLQLISQPKRRTQFALAARQDALQRWERSRVLQQYESYFETILDT